MGLIGKIALDFLIDQLKPTKFAELYSSQIALPDGDIGVTVELNSTYSLPKYEFYAYTKNKLQIILLTGDTQPRPWGQYNVARKVLDFVTKFGCNTLIVLGGYALQRRNKNVIYAVASEPEMVNDLKKFDVLPAQSGIIKGAFGIMLGLGKSRNMKCIGLLGATVGKYPDLQAARNIIQLIAKMFDIPINISEMDKRIEDMESRVKEFNNIRTAIPEKGSQEEDTRQGYIT